MNNTDAPNVAQTLFWNDEGELRSGWRVLIFLFAFIGFTLIFGSVVQILTGLFPSSAVLFHESDPRFAGTEISLVLVAVNRAIALLIALGASAICARMLERRSFASVGVKLHRGWSRDLALGTLLGVLTLVLTVGVIALARAVEFDVLPFDTLTMARRGLLLAVAFFIAAAFEEVLIRGFVFQALLHNLGPAAALLITSVAFALLHLDNPHMSAFPVLNIALAGVWLGVAYLKTRSLWLPTALHFGWNYAMVFLFGLPVSGISMFDSFALLDGRLLPPVWLSGGDFGPEAGVACTLVLIISTLSVWKSGLFTASPEMLEAMRHGKREPVRRPPLSSPPQHPTLDA